MNIHEQMRARKLNRAEYQSYLSNWRKMDRDDYWSSGFTEWPYEEGFEYKGMDGHASDIGRHVHSIGRDPEWMHYTPVSDQYYGYWMERIGDYGGDMEEMRIEQLAEAWKEEQGW